MKNLKYMKVIFILFLVFIVKVKANNNQNYILADSDYLNKEVALHCSYTDYSSKIKNTNVFYFTDGTTHIQFDQIHNSNYQYLYRYTFNFLDYNGSTPNSCPEELYFQDNKNTLTMNISNNSKEGYSSLHYDSTLSILAPKPYEDRLEGDASEVLLSCGYDNSIALYYYGDGHIVTQFNPYAPNFYENDNYKLNVEFADWSKGVPAKCDEELYFQEDKTNNVINISFLEKDSYKAFNYNYFSTIPVPNPTDKTKDDLFVDDDFVLCERPGVLKAFQIIGYALFIMKILVPLILIGMGIYDFAKATISSDDKANSVAISSLVRRCIIAVVIFIMPTILNYVLIMVDGAVEKVGKDSEFSNCTTCLLDPLNCKDAGLEQNN